MYQVKKHIIGTKDKEDIILTQEDDSTLDLYLYESRSKDFIFVMASRTDASYVAYTSCANPAKFILIEPLTTDHLYAADHVRGDEFMIHTNYEAKNYRLCAAKIANPTKENWKDIIPNRKDVFLEDVEYFSTFYVAQESKNGLTSLRIVAPNGDEDDIQFDEPAYYSTLAYNPEFNTTSIRFLYSSLITPFTTYEYDTKTLSKTILKQDVIPSGYDKSQYVTERIMVPARDGKMVPMTIAYRKDKYKKDGTAPGFIYGYGSYGYSNEDYFEIGRAHV